MLSHESDDVVWWWLLLLCCNLFLVARSAFLVSLWHFVPKFLVSARVAFLVSRLRFAFLVSLWHLCNLFLVARISQLNCYAFLVSLWHSRLVSVSRFSSRVSRFTCFAFRVSRFTLTFVQFVSRCAYFRISYHNWVVERQLCYAFLVSPWHLLLVSLVACCVSCFAFRVRVSRFTLAFVAICFSLRVCVSCFTLAFWWWSEAVQDGENFQRVVQEWCARCCARW